VSKRWPGNALENEERYRPVQFECLLAVMVKSQD